LKKTIISIVLLIIVMFIYGCNVPENSSKDYLNQVSVIDNTEKDNLNQEGVNEQMSMRTEKTNLKYYDEVESRVSIDSVLEEIQTYPNIVKEFYFKDAYANFELVTNGVDAAGIYAYFSLANSADKELSDVRIRMSVEKTQTDAKIYLRNFIFSTTAMTLYPSTAEGIYVGDLAIGDEERLTYIRGNVYVDIIGYEGTSIVDLAKEIDQQILEIINKE